MKIYSASLKIGDRTISLVMNNQSIFNFLNNLYEFKLDFEQATFSINVLLEGTTVSFSVDDLVIQLIIEPYRVKYLRAIDYIIRYLIEMHLHCHGIFFLHASSYLYKNKAYVFTGKSGAGKSTILFNVRKNLRIAEDITLIHITKTTAKVLRSPFERNRQIAKLGYSYNFGALYAIIQSKQNQLLRLSPLKQLETLLYNNIIMAGFDSTFSIKIVDPANQLRDAKYNTYKLFINVIQKISVTELHFSKNFRMINITNNES